MTEPFKNFPLAHLYAYFFKENGIIVDKKYERLWGWKENYTYGIYYDHSWKKSGRKIITYNDSKHDAMIRELREDLREGLLHCNIAKMLNTWWRNGRGKCVYEQMKIIIVWILRVSLSSKESRGSESNGRVKSIQF